MSDAQDLSQRIPEELRDGVNVYQQLVKQLAGDGAKALTLYGAIGTGAFETARHRIQSVLVLEAVDLNLLSRIADNGTKLGKAYIAAPLIMTEQYIEDSLDTFPIEFIEIQQSRIHVFGKDCFADLNIQHDHVRLQCEREIKTTLIGLRQGLLAAAGQAKALSVLEIGTAEGLLRTLRAILWLQGEQVAMRQSDVLEKIETIVGSKLDGLRNSLDINSPHGWIQFRALYKDVESIGAYVDAL